MTPLLDKGSFVAVCLVLVLLPLVSHAGGLGVAPLVFILGLLGIALSLKSGQFQITRVYITLIIFLAWLCITALWSPYKPDDLLTNYLKLLFMGVVFYWSRAVFEHASAKHPRRSRHLFMAAIFFTVGLLVIDLLSNFSLTLLFNPATDFNDKIFKLIDAEMNLGHSITIAVLLAAPVIMLMLIQLPNPYARPLVLLFIIMLALAALLNGLAVGLLGLMGVILATIAGYAFPQRAPQHLLNLVIFVIMASPLLSFVAFSLAGDTGTNLPPSWDHRIRMWGYCWDVIMQHPVAGAGFDASRTFDETFISRDGREITIVSLHPHNVGIQIWTEAGLIGAVLASIVIGTLSKPVRDYVQSRAHGGSVSGVIVAMLVISSLTYGAWQFWWWGCLFLAVGALHLLPDFKSLELKSES